MSSGGTPEAATAFEGRRAVAYCLVPAALAPRLHELLRNHFRDDPGVEVVVDRRVREQRGGEDRRSAEARGASERRMIHSPRGRRVGERRAAQIPVESPLLPRRARRYADRLSFVERLEPSTQELEDLDTARVVTRFQAGERELFKALYTRYFERVYSYMRVALRDSHEAEDQTQQVFADILEGLPRYELRGSPFRAWLFTIVRNTAIKHLRRQHRIELTGDEGAIAAKAGPDRNEETEPLGVRWITDPDLLLFVERLPLVQRQVLALRFMLGLETREIAQVLGRSPDAVRQQLSRALRLLEQRLAAIGRGPRHATGRRPIPSLAPIRPMRVLRERRFGLVSPGAG